MTLEEQIVILNQQVHRLMEIVEQQYQCMDMLRQNQEIMATRLEALYASTSSHDAYIAGQISRNSGR